MEEPYVFLDSTHGDIRLNGTGWAAGESSNNTVGGSQLIWKGTGDGTASLEVLFDGRSIAAYGTLDRELVMETYVDESIYHPLDETRGAPSGRRGVKLWGATVISGEHTGLLFPTAGQLAIDYFTVVPDDNAPLDGRDLIFDDVHTSLKFAGAWNPMNSFDLPELPFGDTLMAAGQAGANFTFKFTGSSISVFGVTNSTRGLSAEYSVDGSAPTTANLSGSSRELSLHRRLFQHNITDGPEREHTLTVTVREASESDPFLFDYVVVRGNSHSRVLTKQFKKEGDALNKASLKIGLIVMGISIVVIGWIAWVYYRKKKRLRDRVPATKR
ncbi:hypothetical protein FA15DRAFT_672187 [Coprinopsis marcescibilis]|uniref:Uncharacterized protein n=1 Tax=Coprinopsis marcescibilis TaxID=230819 RepID=A0A5C3KNL2_COPMA|nr:hypothetical protein FA15DRAFT_672187 [Coprinopsis marcescibilis]